jgi:lytic murein transglycosylase
MQFTRRMFTACGAAALAGCTPAIGTVGAFGGSGTRPDPAFRPQPNAGFDTWITSFRGRASAAGLSQSTLDAGLRGVGFLPGVVERDRNQTEFRRTAEEYLAIVASEEKVTHGRGEYARRRPLFDEIAARFGVPGQVVCAFWGVESDYGRRLGDIPVISAVATLAYDGRRGDFFEAQLIAALRIIQNGDTTSDRMVGSWAGAMGHTQFIPTTFAAYAVDFRGDGRREIWSGDPTDALASTASYVSRSGWQRGIPWGTEVRLPDGFDAGLAGRDTTRDTGAWSAMGVRPAAGGSLGDWGAASVLAPAGISGPAFLLTRNFNAILRYNNSTNYALGVGYLSDRIAGGDTLRGNFGPDANGMTMDDRRALQRGLTAAGFDTGTPDGVIGSRSEAAIRDYQAANGLAVTGQPSLDLLRRLR